MKSERRHELQHNELADWLGKTFAVAKPYTNAILGVGLLLILGLVVLKLTSGQSTAKDAVAWDEFYAALDTQIPASMAEVAEKHADSTVASWAAVAAGDMYLAQGCQQLADDKIGAVQELQKAMESYRTGLEKGGNQLWRERLSGGLIPAPSGVQQQRETIRQRSTFGLARAFETLAATRQAQGELEEAVEQYEQLLEGWPEGAYAKLASRRLTDLKKKETAGFYDKMAQYEPPRQPMTPPDEAPAFDLDSLMPSSQFMMPGPLESDAEASDGEATDEEPSDGETVEEETVAEETTEDSPAAEETP